MLASRPNRWRSAPSSSGCRNWCPAPISRSGRTYWLAWAISLAPSGAEQQPGAETWDRQQGGPAQHRGQRPGVVDVPGRLRRDRVDRPGQAGIEHRAQVDVEQVVQGDPGQPLLAGAEPATEADLEQRGEQAQHAAARRLHDAGPDLDRADARRGRRGGGVLPAGHHVGQEPLAARTGLGQDLLAPVRAVDADGRGRDERPEAAGGGSGGRGQLGQLAGGQDPAVADLVLALGGEPAADRRPGQVDHGVHPVQQLRGRVFRPPVALPGPGQPAHQRDDAVPAGGQQRGQRGADQAAGAGDRHRQRVGAWPDRAGAGQRGQVGGELAVPVDEHGPQHPGGQRGLDHVGHQRGSRPRRAELMGVPPGQGQGGEFVGEGVGRVIAPGLMGGDPAQPAGQAEGRAAVPERPRLAEHGDRLPWWSEPDDRSRPGMPGEHLVTVRVYHTGVRQSHPVPAPSRRPTN